VVDAPEGAQGLMSQANVDAALRGLDGWNRGDVDAWLEAVHPDIEWISEVSRQVEGAATVYRGLDEMRRYWDEWHELWSVTIDVTETFDLGDTVVVFADLRTRGGASGIDLERPIAYVFEFGPDGLARRARAYFDPDEALAAARGGGTPLP
jgi:ketosteroid isomerase-like protein